jgi:gamma-glutamyltranspeptidase / glutathione hydrolase
VVTIRFGARAAIVGVASVCVLALGLGAAEQDRGDAPAQGALRTYRPAVPGTRAVVTAAHPLAAMAGADILLKGGNAADAAVAVAATLNVVEPQSSGLGGNGFTTYFDKASGKVVSLSMTGAAPKAVRADAMTEASLNSGINAAIVPGNLGGLIALLDRYGTQRLADVLQPAIRYAEDGHPVHPGVAGAIAGRRAFFAKYETSARVFLPSGQPPSAGELVRMPDYAATLRKLIDAEQRAATGGASRSGALRAAFDRFYKGDIAREIADFFQRHDGFLSAEDLAAYEPQWTAPVHATYRGYDIYSNPSSSRGGIEVLLQLNLLEDFDLRALGAGSPEALHLAIEAIKVAKADVYKHVADSAFSAVPVAGLLSKQYAATRRRLIDPSRAMAYPMAGHPAAFEKTPSAPPRVADVGGRRRFAERYEGDPETTSFSIIDPAGNAVACTPTLGGGFGTGVVVGRTGLLFNNGMRLGSTSPYPEDINYVRGGQIPLLNNAPVIVMKDGRFVLAIGTPGGEGIGQTQFQALLNILDFGMSIQEAIEAPRFVLDAEPNFYKPGAAVTTSIERRTAAETLRRLESMGHTIRLLPEFTPAVGGMQGILVDLRTGTMAGGADPRRAGYAIGW